MRETSVNSGHCYLDKVIFEARLISDNCPVETITPNELSAIIVKGAIEDDCRRRLDNDTFTLSTPRIGSEMETFAKLNRGCQSLQQQLLLCKNNVIGLFIFNIFRADLQNSKLFLPLRATTFPTVFMRTFVCFYTHYRSINTPCCMPPSNFL